MKKPTITSRKLQEGDLLSVEILIIKMGKKVLFGHAEGAAFSLPLDKKEILKIYGTKKNVCQIEGISKSFVRVRIY